MSRRKQKLLIVSIIILIMAVAFCIIACGKFFSPKYDQAISIAQGYLNQKYDQEMIYQDIRKDPIEPGSYHVTFSSSKTPEVEFEVIVPDSLTLPERVWDFSGSDFSADNYYHKYFEYRMKEYLAADVNRLWEGATVRVSIMKNGRYFTNTPELNDTMTLEEIETLIDNYWIVVRVDDNPLDNKSLKVLPNKIFDFIQIINNEGFTPEGIGYYNTSEVASKYAEFSNYSEIETVTQVREQLEAEFAEEVE